MGKKNQKPACIYGAVYMLKQVNRLESEITGALVSDDIEHVHRLRVASRRLRNGLGLFRDCLSPKIYKTYQKHIRRITKALGKARDLDIQIECVTQQHGLLLDANLKPGYERLLLRLKQERTKAQQKVVGALNHLQGNQILETMRSHLELKAFTARNTHLYTPSLYKKSLKAIGDRLDDFLSYEVYIHQPEHIEKLHAMRISGKHLRYTMEIFAPIYDDALLPFVRYMKEIQDQLGEIHDADVWLDWLQKFIRKEQKRIEDYFGDSKPLKELLPGFEDLIENRRNARELEYQSFLAAWTHFQQENVWAKLREILQTSFNFDPDLSPISSDQDKINTQFIEIKPEGETPFRIENPDETPFTTAVHEPPNPIENESSDRKTNQNPHENRPDL